MKTDQYSGASALPDLVPSDETPPGAVPRPPKEDVRAWLNRVIASNKPPPTIEEIQRELWHPDSTNQDGGRR